MLTFLATSSSLFVSVILDGVGSAKLMVSPLAALARAERSVPAPLSAVLVTVMVAARRPVGVAPRRKRAGMNWPMILQKFVFTPDSAKSERETYQQSGGIFNSRMGNFLTWVLLH